jgi:hypothetical protein
MTPMGSGGSLLRFGREEGCAKSKSRDQHEGSLPRFGPLRSVKPWSCFVCILCVLELRLAAMHASWAGESKKSESFSIMPWASFYTSKGPPQWQTGGVKCYSTRAYLWRLRTSALNALLTCPLTLSGTEIEPVPSVAASLRPDTHPR